MGATDLLAAAAIGATCLAIAATLWALAGRAAADARIRALEEKAGPESDGWADAFDLAVIAIDAGRPRLVAGAEVMAACAKALGGTPDLLGVLEALARADPDHAKALEALVERGEACAFAAATPEGPVHVEGRATGAVVWIRLGLGGEPAARASTAAPAGPVAAFLDAEPGPAWILDAEGKLAWANRAWLKAAEATSVEDAVERGLAFDPGGDAVLKEARAAGERRDALRWTPVNGQRRAFNVTAEPLPGGSVGAFALDVTEAEETRESFKRYVEAHDETLNRLADAVAIFTPQKRLSFHNTAFAILWGLEPAWLAEQPTHGEILDRLRQRRRIPETADYGRWKAEELRHYEDLRPTPDDLWTLPDGRTLRVVRQPHPLGGLLLLFEDITGELQLKAQYNALIQVQQATLDKLNDAVAVFGSDGRLRLHNEAFERFWNVSAQDLESAGYFESVVELCLPRLHDLQFWRELKARVTDPDPQARVPTSGESKTSDRRIVLHQSRPLPDGATLIAFTDVTDTRDLEQALAGREAALSEAERLKRDFVGNVSYELRTPLTTIIGYSELLEHAGEGLSDRARGHVAAVRTAASQLARSIDDVLDMAQIDAGEMALDLGDVPLSELMEAAALRWEKVAADAGLKVEVACAPDAGVIRADANRLGQTVDHLIENAIRQTPPGGTVSINARRALGEAQIQVSDTGRGIAFDVQAHIFDRFIGRDRGGPGLGLALVKALVELHGGWVELRSEPGAGATFTCHLPEVANADAAQPELGF